MQLTQDQRDRLWGQDGPKSVARLTFITHIGNHQVSKIIIMVDIEINPLTFEIISKNRKHFANDCVILDIINQATPECGGFSYGWMPCRIEYKEADDLNYAQETLAICQEAVIRMHKFVMELLAPIK